MRNGKKILRNLVISPAPMLFFALLAALASVNAHYLKLGFLSLHSIDEYAFHGSLLNMYDGLLERNIQKFFAFNFYNYGFGFFCINFLATLPFLDGHHNALAIYVPRMVTSLTALIGLYSLYRIARLQLNALTACLFVVLVVSMPAFWVNAAWFHPDWLQITCLLVAFYYFVRNDELAGHNYWYGILWFGLAAGLGKFQAFTFLPFLAVYIFHDEITRLDFSEFTAHLKRAILSFAAVFGTFVALNPYLFHPTGRRAFLSVLDANLLSNATAHGLTVKYSLAEKISHAVFDYYLNPALFIVFVLLSAFWCIDCFRSDKRRSFQALAFYCIIYLGYLLFAVNKDWQSYYLGLLIPGVLLAVPLVCTLRPASRVILLLVALISQVAYYGLSYADIATLSYRSNAAEQVDQHQAISDFIVQSLKDKVSVGSTVLISPYTGFSFETLGINYRNVFVIYGPLGYDMIYAKALALKYPDQGSLKYKLLKFKLKDFIILRRNDVYFSAKQLKQMFDSAGYNTAVEIIGRLNDGDLGYQKIAEGKDVIIYQRTLAPTSEGK